MSNYYFFLNTHPVDTYRFIWILDDYIRLKDITLSYNIPRKWLSKLKMEQIRVYVSGMNLWEKTGLPPFMTPDIVDQITSEGVSLQSENAGKQYAFMRSYSFGINITF